MTPKKKKSDENFEKEMSMAFERVGRSVQELAQWLIDFSLERIDSISEGYRLDLVWETRAFLSVLFELERKGKNALEEGMQLPPSVEGMDSLSDLHTFNHHVSYMISPLIKGEKVTFGLLSTYSLEFKDGKLEANKDHDHDRDPLDYYLWWLIEQVQSHFRLCTECSRPFVQVRHQEYCSPKCSQAVRTRKYREKHKDELREMRRISYIRRKEEKLALTVKTGNRTKKYSNGGN